MGYGVIAYGVKVSDISNYIYGSNNRKIKNYSFTSILLAEVKRTFSRSGSINPDKALDEILAGKLTRLDSKSGSVYRYVLAKACLIPISKPQEEQEEILKKAKALGEDAILKAKVNDLQFSVATKLPNDAFYPIDLKSVEKIFNYPDIPLPFPAQEDFPLTAIISYEEIEQLNSDFSTLHLPDVCYNQFKEWLNYCLENRTDLMLYYY